MPSRLFWTCLTLLAVGMTAAIDIPQGTILQGEMYFDRDAAVSLGKQGASDLFRPGRLPGRQDRGPSHLPGGRQTPRYRRDDRRL